MKIYQIKNYEDYELHYSDEVQLVYSLKSKKYLKLVKHRDGYFLVQLSKNGKQKWILLHRLVWMTLKGDIPQGLEINHRDENKENNCIENLELVSHLQNMRHGTLRERQAKALINHQAFSKPIVAIKKNLSEILQYPSGHEASRDRGFNISHISSCCNNKRKSHKDYIWFYKDDFEEYMNRFQGNLEKVIEYKLSLFNKKSRDKISAFNSYFNLI